MTKKFLLVCEGPSDIAVFEAIAQAHGGKIIEHSPQLDATSSTYPPQGWGAVKNWCLQLAANRSLGNPIDFLLAFKGADGIIIQIDTDIANQIKINGNFGLAGDKGWCKSAIDSWLGKRSGHTKIYYVLCAFSTETWILATYSNRAIGLAGAGLRDYETIPDPQSALIALGYKKNGPTSLFKNKDQYQKPLYAPRVIAHLRKAKARCAALNEYISLF